MSGIYFDPNGVSLDITFTTDEFEKVLNLLNSYKDDIIDVDVCNKFQKIFDTTKKQNDRSIHIVVSEPVEYDYDW